MIFIEPKAAFSLKCNDISLSDTFGDYPVTNNVGTINAQRTEMTWYSVNFENILGDLYKDNDYFNLRLRYVSQNASAAVGTTANDRTLTFNISGLNWTNSTYDVTRGCNTSYTPIATYSVAVNSVAVSTAFEDLFVATFLKQKTCDITIFYLNANFVTPSLGAGTQLPRIAFYFDITPVVINPTTIPLSLSKCSVLSTYYLGGTTTTNNIDMYAVLGRENFELGAKYNLVFKFAQAATWAGSDNTIKGSMFNVSCSGMRFQNYETAINKAAGNQMQLVTYQIFQGITGATAAPAVRRNNTAAVMTFTLEAQFCSLTIMIQNLVNNTEYTVATSNTFICFDIWKCS